MSTMKTQKETSPPVVRINHTAQFNAQVLKRIGADRDSVPKTALDLGITELMLYLWHEKSRQTCQSLEDQKLQEAEAETARLK